MQLCFFKRSFIFVYRKFNNLRTKSIILLLPSKNMNIFLIIWYSKSVYRMHQCWNRRKRMLKLIKIFTRGLKLVRLRFPTSNNKHFFIKKQISVCKSFTNHWKQLYLFRDSNQHRNSLSCFIIPIEDELIGCL